MVTARTAGQPEFRVSPKQRLGGTDLHFESIGYLKFKFNLVPCIFICQIWQPCWGAEGHHDQAWGPSRLPPPRALRWEGGWSGGTPGDSLSVGLGETEARHAGDGMPSLPNPRGGPPGSLTHPPPPTAGLAGELQRPPAPLSLAEALGQQGHPKPTLEAQATRGSWEVKRPGLRLRESLLSLPPAECPGTSLPIRPGTGHSSSGASPSFPQPSASAAKVRKHAQSPGRVGSTLE